MANPAILIVDDEPTVLNAVERDLRPRYGKDYRIVKADSGATALDVATRLQGRGETVALFLVDQRMPQMTGTEFLDKARAVFPEAKKVLLTAYADTEAAISSINKVGLDYYLLKPWDPPEERLYPVLDDLLGAWRANVRLPYEGIRVAGTLWSLKTHELKDFLARYQIPYQFLDVEADNKARMMVEGATGGGARIPVIFFPDGGVLVEPSTHQLADKLGLQTKPARTVYDLAIIGAGPAGLAATVFAASEGLSVVVAEREAPGGQAGSSPKIENYLGFPAGLSGAELTHRALAQARKFGAELLSTCEVKHIKVQDPYRILQMADGLEIVAKSVLLATGATFHMMKMPGAAELTGKGIYYGAAYTEAIYFKGQDVFVVGGANSAGQAAIFLSQFARKVTMLVRGELTTATYLTEHLHEIPNIEIRLNNDLAALHGKDHLEAVTVHDTVTGVDERLEGQGMFVFIGVVPRSDYVADLVKRDAKGSVLTGSQLRVDGALPKEWMLPREPYMLETNVPGIFAAGDIRQGTPHRVASAAGEGGVAVSMIKEYLKSV
ncbi:MAG: FAD-dependent oxidoreductase [Anaerolineae bacterium]